MCKKINLSNFNIGFEFEFCSPLEDLNNITFDEEQYNKYIDKEIKYKIDIEHKSLSLAKIEAKNECNFNNFILDNEENIWKRKVSFLKDSLQLEISENINTSFECVETGNSWFIKFDDDIKGKEHLLSSYKTKDYGLEISTSVYDIDSGISILNKVLSFINHNGYTNYSTGLHISIDDKRYKKENQNWLKLATLFDDIFFTKQFDRQKNINNKSLFNFFKTINYKDYLIKNNMNYDKLEQSFKEWILKDRTYSINFQHDNYYEFRVSGGKDYETKFTNIKNNIIRFCELIEECNSLDNEEYHRKIESLLFRNKQ